MFYFARCLTAKPYEMGEDASAPSSCCALSGQYGSRSNSRACAEAAELLAVAPKTVQRRLDRGLQLLTERLGDLRKDEG